MDDALVRRLDAVARRSRGLIRTEQAVTILGRGRTRRWVADGRLEYIQPRVLRLLGSPSTWEQRALAASLSARGPISHRTAAILWGLMEDDDSVDVTVQHPRQVKLWNGANLHRIRDISDDQTLIRHGWWVTSPMRTIIDLGLVVSRHEVDLAIGRGINSRLFGVTAIERVRAELARPGRTGTGVARRALDARLIRGGDEDSKVEVRFLRLLRRAGLPSPSFQHEVWHEGRFVARIDAAFPDLPACDRGRRVRRARFTRCIPKRPNSAEPPRRAGVDRPAIHVGRRRSPPQRSRRHDPRHP